MTLTFGPLHHTTLGFERIFHDMEKMLDNNISKAVSNFPPHNILKLDNNRYIVELAIAGFSKNEIDITVEDGNLIIKGTKADKEEETEYLYKGIGTRSFTKTLRIADTVEVKGAEFADGILKIGLENIIPDHKKPRKVEIGKQIKFAKAELLTE